jgi:glycosyltransferase involved in cell wall biosynthesis
MKQPPVSIVVPVYNGARTIAACLQAIGEQDYQGETELVVVNNASTDNSAAIIAQYAFARQIDCAKRGPAAARNAGIASTRHPIIAFTDADCIPQQGWLTNLVAALQPGLAAVGGSLASAARGPVEDVVAAISFDQKQSIESSLPYVITANCLFRREALESIGGFDEEFPIAGGEDTDLGWRLVAQGARFAYAETALCLHNHPTRLMDLISQRVRYGYAMSLLWAKYRGSSLHDALAAILPSWPILCLSIGNPASLRDTSHRLRAAANTAYFAGWILGGGLLHGATSPTQRRRRRSDRMKILLASPAAAFGCAAALAAMFLSGRLRRVFRPASPAGR